MAGALLEGDAMHNLIAIALGLSLLACGKSDSPSTKTGEAPKEEPKKTEPKKAATAPEPPKATPVKIDPEIAKLAKVIATKCEIDEAKASVSCDGNEKYEIYSYAAKNQVAGVYESLAELALTEGAKDKKLFAAIVGTWNTLKDRELQAKASTPAAGERVVKLFALVPDTCDAFGYAAPVALAAGKRGELVAALDKVGKDSTLRRTALRYFLDWGGVAALPDVQKAYETAPNDWFRNTAAAAVGTALRRPGVAEDDRKKMCDWVKAIAADAASPDKGFEGAVDSLGRCKGTYIDDALGALEARKLSDAVATGLYHMCWAEGEIGGDLNGTPAQCERTLAILAKQATANKDTAPADALWMATFAIKHVAKDAGLKAKATGVLTALSTSKHKRVADEAKQALKE